MLGVCATSVTSYEHGHSRPQRKIQAKLSAICQAERIAFMPSGMPVPMDDILPPQEVYE